MYCVRRYAVRIDGRLQKFIDNRGWSVRGKKLMEGTANGIGWRSTASVPMQEAFVKFPGGAPCELRIRS